MSKHFILSVDLFRKIKEHFSRPEQSDPYGNILCDGHIFCTYDIVSRKPIETEYITIDFRKENEEKVEVRRECSLYMLLHASDERFLRFKTYTHFEIPEIMLDNFWAKDKTKNQLSGSTQLVFFKHDIQSCTAYSLFMKSLDLISKPVLFTEKIIDLFRLHNTEKRNTIREHFLSSLGYGSETNTSNRQHRNLTPADIKKYYV